MNKYNEWLNSEYITKEDKEILKNMSKEEIEEAFFTDLEFGTAGIRGKMGLGTNRLNKYTIGKVTVGYANYLNKTYDNPSVAIAYDTRNNSKDFALDTALILNYYGVKTYLFKDVASTPELAFACKYLKCSGAVVITSSHNGKIYNGYKVYNALGGQIVPPEDELIINEVNNITSYESIKKAPINNELFEYTSDDVHKAFIDENKKVILDNDLIKKYAKNIKITYSSLHGVGLKTAEEIFKELGFINYNIVSEQCTYDGNFPTAPEPNPEYIENYELAKKYAKENDSDIILITDPDADRLGVMYKNNNGEYTQISGDFLGAVFAYYMINNMKINDNSYMIRSIVTSPFIDKICKKNNVNVFEVLTGCKNIAHKRHIENGNYLFGYEESQGYMFNLNIDDKNGFSSMIFMLQILCCCKDKNISLEDYMNNIYNEYGFVLKETLNFTIKDINYKEIINKLMDDFRNDVVEFNNKNYNKIDYLNEVGDNKTNALKYVYDNGSWIMIRPSGTEPKIKIYVGVISENKDISKNILNNIINEVNNIVKSRVGA